MITAPFGILFALQAGSLFQITNIKINAQIAEWKSKTINTDEFLKIVDAYTEITELNQEVVNAFIDKIVVHERSDPHKRKGYTQEVDVYFNFIGKLGKKYKQENPFCLYQKSLIYFINVSTIETAS